MERSPKPGVASEFLPKTDAANGYEADFARKREAIERAVSEYDTPFHLYDEAGIRATVRNLADAFSWAPEYKEFFAVKALPNRRILEIMRDELAGADASSGPELILAEQAGLTGENIMFTSNNTPAAEFRMAAERGAIVNFDDVTHLDYYRREVGPFPELACLRYTPGSAFGGGNEIIGASDSVKFGMNPEQLQEGIAYLKRHGVKRFGLHMMAVSNELNELQLHAAADLLFGQARELSARQNIEFDFINVGGGFGIPYRPEERPLDLAWASELYWQAASQVYEGYGDPRIFSEFGRYVTGPHGVLVTKARHVMQKGRAIVGVDATMADLMRPGMYDAYHHITVMGKEGLPVDRQYDVVGSLCENNDKFATQRLLPEVEPGDTLVIHDAAAHGRAMGFNYNGKLRCGELLLRVDGSIQPIRRPETADDYFATQL